MPEGQIVKALSGYYYVQEKGSDKRWQCRARGIFKKERIHPLVGDFVLFETTAHDEGTIIRIFERKNELVRPPIANVDQALLVFSIAEPELSLLLLDRLLVHIEKAAVQPIVCLSKLDLQQQTNTNFQDLIIYQEMGYPLVKTSSKTGEGLDQVIHLLKDKMTVFAGQSGVGKSSLLNALNPAFSLETKKVSDRLGRGRHTTRHVELLPIPQGGLVADTPGFSQLDFGEIDPQDLAQWFKDFNPYISRCKFRGCLHENEPDCAVKKAKDEGKIAVHRYAHYLQFLTEIKKQHRKRY